MGRKRIPKNQRREVISLSLKPSTIDLIDTKISASQSRSVFVENILLKYLKQAQVTQDGVTVIRDFWDCVRCEKGYSKLRPNSGEMLCPSCGLFLKISESIKEEI